ncbi:4-hydroxy-tetrahydrodipicolinate reductase, partial [Streptococcus sp. KR]
MDTVHLQGMGMDDHVKLFASLDEIKTDADVWIDFTVPGAAFENAKFAIQHGIHPVIGTSGITDDQV